jgi:hypothetical protein
MYKNTVDQSPVPTAPDLHQTIQTSDGRVFESKTRIRREQYGLYEFLGEVGLVKLSDPVQSPQGTESRVVYVDTSLEPGTVLNVRKWLQNNVDPDEDLASMPHYKKVSLVEQAKAETRVERYADDANYVAANRPETLLPFGDKLIPPHQFAEHMARREQTVIDDPTMDSGELPYPKS